MPIGPKPRADGWERLSDFALVFSIGLVICRCLMLESVRDAFGVVPGQDVILRSPNAAVTVILDVLSFLPGIAVCVRALLDRRFGVSILWSGVILATIGAVAIASAFWSADRFSAGVSASRYIPGAVLIWAIAQCVRDWRAFRMVCGILAGVLAVFIVHSLIYVYSDLPQMQRVLEENRDQILKERGFTEGSFQAAQFERKVAGGEVMGFCASPNSFAALTVLVALCLLGDVGQKLISRSSPGTLVVPLLLLGGAGWIILRTQSVTAMATPVLGVGLLMGFWMMRGVLARHRKGFFAAGLVAAGVGIAGVVGHGIAHGTLLHRSLTFRWQYWQGSFAMFKDHPWFGVGWDNFGLHYLAYRLPSAPEEIRDPHNLFVRFATELGVVGLVLVLAWVCATAWAISRPLVVSEARGTETHGVGRTVAAVASGIALSLIFNLDWSQDAGVLQLEALRRLMYGAIMLGVSIAFGATDLKTLRESNAPAPMLALGVGVAIALFLLHNMIDFAFFEAGPFYLAVLVVGALAGLRLPHAQRVGKATAASAMAVIAVMALAQIIVLVVPVVGSENELRSADAAIARRQFATAERSYATAFESSGWLRNADCLMRQAAAMTWAGRDPRNIVEAYRRATFANPRLGNAYVAIADFSSRSGDTQSLMVAGAVALQLNPTAVSLRVDLAEMFARAGLKQLAATQYREALRYNDLLPPEEPKRLTRERESEVRGRLDALEK